MTTEQSLDEVHGQPMAAARVGPWSRFVTWANQDTIEDFSLRYAPKSFRKWSPMACAVAALGGIAYLADYSIGAQVWTQLKGVLLTIVWSGVVSFVAYKIVDMVVGLRVPEDEEREGLDITSHGESAYHS